ncbi:MAG: beta-galactosidase [Pirellulaceae bacterium]
MKLDWEVLAIATLLAANAAYAEVPQDATDQPEFIRVAADQWTFAGESSGKRFIPFGSNFVFYCPSDKSNPQGIDVLARVHWDPVVIRKAFEGASSLHMNVMKVFLPSHLILRDPQTNDRVVFAEMVPSLPERLDYLFQTARETGVYVSLTFAEWGAHSLRWWQDGGTFVGRGNELNPDIDSYAVLRSFWKTLAERYKNEPMLFSYNLAVEFYMPGGNWGAQKGGEPKYDLVLADRWGLPAWHAYLAQAIGEIADINARWKTNYATLADIPQPEYAWIPAESRYSMPQAMLADYGSFKEYVTYAFFRNEVDAIRSVDKRHMITCGYHPHHPAIGWMGSAQYVAGAAPPELDLLDYTTVHLYTNHVDYTPGVTPTQFHGAVVGARFAWAGKPVMAEEMGHITRDRAETARESSNLVKTLMPHVSGFMLWFLSDVGPNDPYGPLGTDLAVNSFGEEWRKLIESDGLLSAMPGRREPPARTVTVNRLDGMAPIKLTESQLLIQNWDASPQPVDFVLEKNPMIERLRQNQRLHEKK